MDKKEIDTKKVESKTVVVDELPTQQVRTFVGEDGENYNVVTISEALQEILEGVRLIKKSIA